MLYLGIDPGVSGGFASIAHDRASVNVVAFNHVTPLDIVSVLKSARIAKAYIENVHSMPAQGVRSVFTFGQNYGWWLGVLSALEIPFERVTPQRWQTTMSCLTRGNKNISKARAQELFPNMKITHATADALLIAEYGRRKEVSVSGVSEKSRYEEG